MEEAVTGNYGRHWLVVVVERFRHLVMNACYEENGLVRENFGRGGGGGYGISHPRQKWNTRLHHHRVVSAWSSFGLTMER